MVAFDDFFEITITEDKLAAYLTLNEGWPEGEIEAEAFKRWLKAQHVKAGLINASLNRLIEKDSGLSFPVLLAEGKTAVDGEDGTIRFLTKDSDTVNIEERESFRDIHKIPTVEKDEKIATITLPTKEQDGFKVNGKVIHGRKGKNVKYTAGENVYFDDETLSFYSSIIGKPSIGHTKISVFNTYEVNEDVSMKTGNIKFEGSVSIRGNVPEGYSVEATGDVYVYGLVEASQLTAGGSVHITEGIVGMKKGMIEAGVDVNIGYINQATVIAGQNINVNNSILHSECTAQSHIYCQSGHIIGGVCSAGESIEAKDIGNKMDTKTTVAIAVNQKSMEILKQLDLARDTLLEDVKKLKKLGQGLEAKAQAGGLSSKERILLLKQKNTLQLTEDKLMKIEAKKATLTVSIGEENEASLLAKGTLYPNVDLCFGKYQETTKKAYKYSRAYLEDGEIMITPISNRGS
ncbi:hypothetical protein HMI01_03970 [Halolactibacillus miurensis]|uniref:Flagellar Assembly Protein A N-terminal region domain-containing protein n=1 Tax=Halolactibacillus miurensis TaxID=306541 RepID=A0A1I6QFH5_9BACI|nr:MULTISPECIES: FapA family protein [Halolactibacillus]GEM03409.1 hypothetical protein HMI01_03970 [Halolactibacillus miurensis]SFS51050.1 hypothetical protein SAMN05421668_104112 [Halolactibacillus miurensis]